MTAGKLGIRGSWQRMELLPRWWVEATKVTNPRGECGAHKQESDPPEIGKWVMLATPFRKRGNEIENKQFRKMVSAEQAVGKRAPEPRELKLRRAFHVHKPHLRIDHHHSIFETEGERLDCFSGVFQLQGFQFHEVGTFQYNLLLLTIE